MILCDNIVFELQPVGGVSKYWSKTIERLDRLRPDLSYLEGPSVARNAFRRELALTRPVIAERGPADLRRFTGPRLRSDVFHSSYYRTSRRARANVVTIHDFMNEMFPSSFRDPVLAWLKRRACRQADRIVVVSERTRQDLLRHYPDVDPGRVEVIYNGVDEEFFPDPAPGPFLAKGQEVTPGGYFLYVGTRGHCKNFPFVLRFLAEARRQGLALPLVIVGGGPLSEAERAEARGLGLPDDALVQLSGIASDELRRLYSGAVALLIPSLYEGFGLPAAEAARCGTLVLASRGSALEEITGETEFAFDLAREGEAARILALGLDSTAARAERARMLNRSRMFDWNAASERLVQVYESLGSR